MAASEMNLPRGKRSPSKCVSKRMASEASPDSKCPICLDRFKNMAYLDLCLHKFCFCCIYEWSKNKAECPLCKQPFDSIYHSIKAENDFKKYDLRPIENGSFGSMGGQRFRYRTTLTGDHRPNQRRTSRPPDPGVMFEGLHSSTLPEHERGFHQMMMRFAARRRAESEGRLVHSVREKEMINFRRALYRRGIRVRCVQDGGRFRDTSAEFYRRNPACLHRIVPWLKRELMVLYGSHGSLVNIVQHVIMSQITRCDLEGQAIQDELRPFLQARTDHFLHEFLSFARSPFNLEAYDQHAVYDCPARSSEEGGGSSNSSVIAISEDEMESVEAATQTTGPTLSQTPWDDETPGPSYSTNSSQRATVSLRDSDAGSSVEDEAGLVAGVSNQVMPNANTNEGEDASGSEDCVIVGFVKPVSERTPELVQLSSDSEEESQDETLMIPRLPQHIRFSTPSPARSLSVEKSLQRAQLSPRMPGRDGHPYSLDRPLIYNKHLTSKAVESKNARNVQNERQRHHAHDRIRQSSRSSSRSRRRSRSRSRSRSRKRSRSGSRSRSRRRSRSRSRSRHRLLHSSRNHVRSHSRERLYSKPDEESRRSSQPHNSASHSYTWQSCRYYSCVSSRGIYTEKRSSYTNCFRSPEHRRSWESHRQVRRHSRSRSRSPSSSSRQRSRHEKPSGKRKYKTRHLEESPREGSLKLQTKSGSSGALKEKKKKNKDKRHKKAREKSSKRSRSPSVEILYEDEPVEHGRRHHKKKKKNKRKSKRRKSQELTEKQLPTAVITIDSDSDRAEDDAAANSDLICPTDINKDPTTDALASSIANTKPLESVLQDWEQQIPPVTPNSSTSDLSRQSCQTNRSQCDVTQNESEQSEYT